MQIYLDYTKQMKGMVSLVKSEKDGSVETHSSVNLFGEYMVHTLASIAIIGNSLQEFNNSECRRLLNENQKILIITISTC